jgi:hypothetical protein
MMRLRSPRSAGSRSSEFPGGRKYTGETRPEAFRERTCSAKPLISFISWNEFPKRPEQGIKSSKQGDKLDEQKIKSIARRVSASCHCQPRSIDRKSFDWTAWTGLIALMIEAKAPPAQARATMDQSRSRTAADERPPPRSRLSASWRAVLLILVLTLAVWVLFWQLQRPLDSGSTAVVALVFAVLVAAGQFVLSRLRRGRAPQVREPP